MPVLREQAGEEADERVRAQIRRQIRFELGRLGLLGLYERQLLDLRALSGSLHESNSRPER